jgi:hypothetical protein
MRAGIAFVGALPAAWRLGVLGRQKGADPDVTFERERVPLVERRER